MIKVVTKIIIKIITLLTTLVKLVINKFMTQEKSQEKKDREKRHRRPSYIDLQLVNMIDDLSSIVSEDASNEWARTINKRIRLTPRLISFYNVIDTTVVSHNIGLKSLNRILTNKNHLLSMATRRQTLKRSFCRILDDDRIKLTMTTFLKSKLKIYIEEEHVRNINSLLIEANKIRQGKQESEFEWTYMRIEEMMLKDESVIAVCCSIVNQTYLFCIVDIIDRYYIDQDIELLVIRHTDIDLLPIVINIDSSKQYVLSLTFVDDTTSTRLSLLTRNFSIVYDYYNIPKEVFEVEIY